MFAELFDHRLEIEADTREFHFGGLGAQGVALAVEFLAQEIEATAARLIPGQQFPGASNSFCHVVKSTYCMGSVERISPALQA